MTVQTTTNLSIAQFILNGNPETSYAETILQDAGRATPLAQYTWMHQVPSSGKWIPFDLLVPTFAKMVCGAFGTNLAGIQAVTDGEFNITIDGASIDVTGLDFSGITALSDMPGVINTVLDVYGVKAVWDDGAGAMSFVAVDSGNSHSVSVLAAVSGGGGTDISGSGFLNGLTGTGTATAGTSETPDGIYMGTGLTAAEMQAGDVTLQPIMNVSGGRCEIASSKMVFEGSITLASVLVDHGIRVDQYLRKNGWIPVTTYNDSNY